MIVEINETTLASFAAAVLLFLCCGCGDSADPAVVARVKGEIAAGRKEYASMQLDQIAAELRGLRVLNKRLVKDGKMEESRRVTARIIELEALYRKVSEQ